MSGNAQWSACGDWCPHFVSGWAACHCIRGLVDAVSVDGAIVVAWGDPCKFSFPESEQLPIPLFPEGVQL